MTVRKFWIAYLLVIAFTLTTVYVVVGNKEEMSLVLSDTQMQKIVGSAGAGALQGYVCNNVDGCDPKETGTCIPSGSKGYIYQSVTSKEVCDFTNDDNDYCNQSNWTTTCKEFKYDDNDCQTLNTMEPLEYYTDCNADP